MLSRFQITFVTLISLTALVFAPLVWAAPFAQNTQPDETAAIVIEGPVQAINVNIITIADIDITLESTEPLLTTIQVGDVVQIQGDVDDTTDTPIITATSIVVTNTNIITPVITLTGPVQAINVNIVTVLNFDIQFNPNDLILAELNVGDIISVGGNLISTGSVIAIIPIQVVIVVNIDTPDPEATPEATPDPESTPEPDSDPSDLPVTMVVEGPVQEINVNVITIFNINIEVEPNAPILADIHIGDHIRVEGNPKSVGNTIIIVAVNITIVNIIVVDNNPDVIIVNTGLPDGCKISKNGRIKCSKKSKKSKKS